MTLLHYQPPQQPFLQVLYRQHGVVAVNKPGGLLSVPGKDPAHKDSIWWRASRVWPEVRIVHRLDMATSGVILLALDKPTQAALNKQFELRQVGKEYRARVWGQLPAQQGVVDLPMRCDWPNRPRQMVDLAAAKPRKPDIRYCISSRMLPMWRCSRTPADHISYGCICWH